MLIGIGTTLVALGAFLALVVALAPIPDANEIGRPEHYRRKRIATLTTVFAGVLGLAGAGLLITSAWPWSLIAVVAATLLYYLLMVAATYRDNRDTLRWIRVARDIDQDDDGQPGRIWLWTAAWMSVAPLDVLEADDAPAWYGAPGDPGAIRVADHVQRIAVERARLVWAVQHPFDGGSTPRSVFRTLIFRLRYRLEVRQMRRGDRMVHPPVHTRGSENID